VPRVRLAEVVRELPRRAHDLSRKEVEASQRWRMLEAVTEVTAKTGYLEASVADVIAAAGVSRKTFYEHFRDKEECFLTAYDVLSEQLVRALVGVGADVPAGAPRRRAQMAAFLGALAKDPAAARVFMVDVLGAGPRALKRRERVNASFAAAVLGDALADPLRRAAIVGGVNNVVAGALIESRTADLRALVAPLSAFMEDALGPGPRKRRP
jgi:AcrR family transcriptional regulator